jgi:type IV pilus assembly protein PilM
MFALPNIARFIAPPAFITLPSAGVDISDTSIKYVVFSDPHNHNKELFLKSWGEIDLPENTFSRGSVENQERFVEAMRQVAGACGTPYVRVSLPEERAYLFETEIKRGTPHNEIRGLLEFSLEENVPLSPRDAYFDYQVFEDPLAQKDGFWRVVVTVYGREVITQYYEACRAAGLIPISFEVEAQAIARATIPTNATDTRMIIDFGKTRSGVGIVHRGILAYTSTIDIGGAELSNTLRKVVGEISESELTKIKNTQGLIRGSDNGDVADALISHLSIVKDEIKTRIDYWKNRERYSPERDISSIILCGGSANLKGLPEYFSETLEIPTVRADIWQNAFSIERRIPPIGRRYSYGYATAVGLALGGHRFNV